MGIFSGAQGQLTPQSVIGSGRNSNSFKLSMHVIITCKYEKDWLKTAEKKWQHRFSIITLSVAMGTSSRIWPNFKVIQALMYVIVTCKYEIDPKRIAVKKWQHRFSHFTSMGIFSGTQEQLTPQSVVRSG